MIKKKMTKEEKQLERDKKLIDIINSTDDINEFWDAAKKILEGSLVWEKLEELYENGAKKASMSFFCNFDPRMIGLTAGSKEAKAIKFLTDEMKSDFERKDNQSIIRTLFMMIVRHLVDMGEEPCNKEFVDLDFEKDVFPIISGDMLMPYSILSALSMGKIPDCVNDFDDKEEEKLFALLTGLWCEMEDLLMVENILRHKNLKRKKQIEALLEKPSKVLDEYFDIRESDMDDEEREKSFFKLIDREPDYFDSYHEVLNMYENQEKYHEAEAFLFSAVTRALDKIVDYKGRWPKQMPWSYIENRHLIRLLDRFAYDLWKKDRHSAALFIYRRLLKSNHGDNVGARYNILAILMGYDPGDVEDEFPAERDGYVDVGGMMKWFEDNAVDFDEEFGWWFEEMERQREKEKNDGN